MDNRQKTVKSTAGSKQAQSAADGTDFCDLLSWLVDLYNGNELLQ